MRGFILTASTPPSLAVSHMVSDIFMIAAGYNLRRSLLPNNLFCLDQPSNIPPRFSSTINESDAATQCIITSAIVQMRWLCARDTLATTFEYFVSCDCVWWLARTCPSGPLPRRPLVCCPVRFHVQTRVMIPGASLYHPPHPAYGWTLAHWAVKHSRDRTRQNHPALREESAKLGIRVPHGFTGRPGHNL